MKKQIQAVRTDTFRKEEHFGLMQQFFSKLGLLPEGKATAEIAAFRSAFGEEDKVLEQNRSNRLSRQLIDTDILRDKTWKGLDMIVDVMRQHPDAEMQAAAERVKEVIDTYGDPRNLPYIQENGTLTNLVQALEVASTAADVTKIHATDWVTDLKKYNDEFIRLFGERNTEYSTQETAVVLSARKKTDAAYRELVQMVNALALVDTENNYAPFIDEINTLISYQRNVIARRKAEAAKKKQEEEATKPEETKPEETKPEETK